MLHDTGTIEYEGEETLYIIEEKINGTELRQLIKQGMRFSLEDAVHFLEQGLNFISSIEKEKIVHRDIKLSFVKLQVHWMILLEKDYCP